jgi:hypothetical protein
MREEVGAYFLFDLKIRCQTRAVYIQTNIVIEIVSENYRLYYHRVLYH